MTCILEPEMSTCNLIGRKLCVVVEERSGAGVVSSVHQELTTARLGTQDFGKWRVQVTVNY